MTNKSNTVLYTGITSNIVTRVYQHKNKLIKGFTYKYNVSKLVYFEVLNNPLDAITREKQIKSGSRKKKIMLIEKENLEWKDLYSSLL